MIRNAPRLVILSLAVFLMTAPGCVNTQGPGGSAVGGSTTTTLTAASSAPESVDTTTIIASTHPGTVSTTLAVASTVKTAPRTVGVTYAVNISIGDPCDLSEECASGCCKKTGSARKCTQASDCKAKTVTEDECYAKGWFWCAGRCQNESCQDCGTYLRCVNVMENGANKTKVESASTAEGRAGSCRFNGLYTAADGADGFCHTHKGTLIYARCGLSPTWEDCAAVNGGEKGTYEVGKQRAFASSAGSEYDLWCFKCARVG